MVVRDTAILQRFLSQRLLWSEEEIMAGNRRRAHSKDAEGDESVRCLPMSAGMTLFSNKHLPFSLLDTIWMTVQSMTSEIILK